MKLTLADEVTKALINSVNLPQLTPFKLTPKLTQITTIKLFAEDPNVRESKLVMLYLEISGCCWNFLMTNNKILTTFFSLMISCNVILKGHLEYLHPGSQLWFNIKPCFVVNHRNSRHDSVRRWRSFSFWSFWFKC